MSEIVERVARAIYSANPAEEGWQGVGHEPKVLPWEEAPDDHEWCLEAARAAIEAMRPMTDDMREQFMKIIRDEIWEEGGATDAWSAMIDAALKEPT